MSWCNCIQKMEKWYLWFKSLFGFVIDPPEIISPPLHWTTTPVEPFNESVSESVSESESDSDDDSLSTQDRWGKYIQEYQRWYETYYLTEADFEDLSDDHPQDLLLEQFQQIKEKSD